MTVRGFFDSIFSKKTLNELKTEIEVLKNRAEFLEENLMNVAKGVDSIAETAPKVLDGDGTKVDCVIKHPTKDKIIYTLLIKKK